MRIPYKQPSESPFKNHFMNGGFDFWQRATSFTSFEGKIADRFSVGYAVSPGRATWSRDNSVVHPNGLTTYSLKAQTSIIDAAPAAGALGLLRHRLEGNYFRALKGKTFYLKGKIYTNVTGDWTLGFSNASESNRWLDQINVPVANTWTDFILDVTHNPAIGSWNYNELSGLHVIVPVVTGTNHQTAAANKRNWNTSTGWTITGSANANFHSSLSNVLYLAQLQLVTDPDEPFQRMGGSIAEELKLCQRYYADMPHAAGVATSANSVSIYEKLEQTMRIPPVASVNGTGILNAQNGLDNQTQSSPSISTNFAGTNFVILVCGNFPALTSGRMINVGVPANNGNSIRLDAEF